MNMKRDGKAIAKKKAKKRLVRGKDWHAWAWKAGKTWSKPGELFWWAEPNYTRPRKRPTESGKWVRVKFVEVTK